MGILQIMVNLSPDPTRPDGSELPTFSYGGEGIPRVLKQYRFFSASIYFPIRWSNQLNQSERRIYAPLTWITTDPGNDLVSARRQAIAWTNFHFIINCTATNTLQWCFSRLKKKMHLEMICKIVVILSRPQCVKHGIDLYRYHYSHVSTKYWPNGYTCNRVNKTPERATFRQARYYRDYENPLHTRKQCVPDLSIALVASNDTSGWKYDILSKWWQHVAIIY